LKLNGTHWLLVYADDDNILCWSISYSKKKTEAVVAAAKDIELEAMCW
jgi:hypothetical protein